MATATSAWSKPGAWALESENQAAMEKLNLSTTVSDPSTDFPSLSSAIATKPSKKKKPQTQSLAEFKNGGNPINHDSFSHLPTGPRERTAEELDRPSRGFSYSTSRVSSDDPRRNPLNRDSAPCRADEVDDWGSMKRSVGVSERRERGGGSFFDSQSRADEVDSWVSKRSEKRDGFDRSDTWGRRREEVSNGGGGGGRPRLVLQPRTVPMGNCEGNQGEKVAAVVRLNPFGLARPREEVLAEKGKDWKKVDEKMKERIDGSLGEDRTERSWRKEVASHDVIASMYGFFIHLTL